MMSFQPEKVSLHDGTPIVIRAIQPDDAERVIAMHARLSEHTLFLRYLSVARQPVVDQAAHMCDIDYETRMALVAVPADIQPERLSAIACYVVPDEETPGSAEVAIVVEDAYQARGLGSILLVRLARYAQAHGIRRLTADVSVENGEVLAFIQHTGLPHEDSAAEGVIHVSVMIDGDLTKLEQSIMLSGNTALP